MVRMVKKEKPELINGENCYLLQKQVKSVEVLHYLSVTNCSPLSPPSGEVGVNPAG